MSDKQLGQSPAGGEEHRCATNPEPFAQSWASATEAHF